MPKPSDREPDQTRKPAFADWDLQPAAEEEPSPSPPPPKQDDAPAVTSRPLRESRPSPRTRRNFGGAPNVIESWLNRLILLSGLAFGLAWHHQDQLPPPKEMLPTLSQAPVQTPLEDPPFSFSYRKHDYQVRNFASYELWGLIVSHNNISGLSDIYHTADSLDTKDVCVAWGGNLASDDYLRVKFESGAWTCNFTYPEGVSFNPYEASNNHLITDSDGIRQTIAKLRIGDQIHIRGRLVGYRDTQWGEFWRDSSLTRTDRGDHACEVVFVEDVEILKTGNAVWRKTYPIAAVAGLVFLAIRTVFFLAYLFQPADARLGLRTRIDPRR